MAMIARTVSIALITLAVLAAAGVAFAAPPVGWRNDGTGKFPAADPPVNWDNDSNIVWRVETPGRSLASPVVVGDRVFITAEPAELVCYAAGDGEKLWQRSHLYVDVFGEAEGALIDENLAEARKLEETVSALNQERDSAQKANDTEKLEELKKRIETLREQIAKLTVFPPMPGGNTANTASTPTSDGENVYAVFGTGIVSSHSLDGTLNWMKFVEAPGNRHSASPVLVDGKLIVHLSNLVALDAASGETVWTAEAGARNGSPVVANVEGRQMIVTPGGAVVRVADGRIVARDQFQLSYSSPTVDGGVVYAGQDSGIKAVSVAGSASDDAVTQVAWESDGSQASRLASPVYHDGLLYTVTEQGILEVTDARAGELVYRKRLEFGGGRVDPSVTLAGDYLYVSNTQGATVVLRPGREYEEVARCQLDDGFSSSLFFAGRRLYVRSGKFLYCIEEQ